jgi:hypothetical protein
MLLDVGRPTCQHEACLCSNRMRAHGEKAPHRKKQKVGLTDRLNLESTRLRERARALGPCQARIRKACQMDEARAMAEFLKSSLPS